MTGPQFRGPDGPNKEDRARWREQGWRYVSWPRMSVDFPLRGWPGMVKAARNGKVIKAPEIRRALGIGSRKTANRVVRLFEDVGLLTYSPGQYVAKTDLDDWDEDDWDRATSSVTLLTSEPDAFEWAWRQASEGEPCSLYVASCNVKAYDLVDLEGVLQSVRDYSVTRGFAPRVSERPHPSWMLAREVARKRLGSSFPSPIPYRGTSRRLALETRPLPRFVIVVEEQRDTGDLRAQRALEQSRTDGIFTMRELTADGWATSSAYAWRDKALRGGAIEVVSQGGGRTPTTYRFTQEEVDLRSLPE